MSFDRRSNHDGFILVEALVALVIIGLVFLALEGSLNLVLRQLAGSEREAIATRMAETQRERAFASACASGSGSDSTNGVALHWTASSAGGVIRVAQTGRYVGAAGTRVEIYDAVAGCQ